MWEGFDPRAEPLETEVLKEWTEDGVALKIVRFRIGQFKGQRAMLAAVYGAPVSTAKDGAKIPGLVQIHGGGQYADYKACLANAKLGFATVSIAWAGRISAPGYTVSPNEVKLFWDGKSDDPRYRVTTDWGVLDGYHAPGRNRGNVFPSAKTASWTLDAIESPRNSGWFLCALAARRALTFLEQQSEVDAERLGVYGHSMGGKLTVMASVDPRVKAAAPSCGGISDRYNDSPLFRETIGDDVSLKHVQCPILFLSPSNDFHGRVGDLPAAVQEIQTDDWRVVSSPHHNHQDTSEYEVATMLWMQQHLQENFQFPETPETILNLSTRNRIPAISVTPDQSREVLAVDIYYTQQGQTPETNRHLDNAKHRFWRHRTAHKHDDAWISPLPVMDVNRPLWVFANVRYKLDKPVKGAGYYYGSYRATEFVVSSLIRKVAAEELTEANVMPTLTSTSMIEPFDEGWQKEWFSYRPDEWARTTHKLNDPMWKAHEGAALSFEVRADEPNDLVIVIDEYASIVKLTGGSEWQTVQLSPSDFRSYSDTPLTGWQGVRRLTLSSGEFLKPGRGESGERRRIGSSWNGQPPEFRTLQWVTDRQ